VTPVQYRLSSTGRCSIVRQPTLLCIIHYHP